MHNQPSWLHNQVLYKKPPTAQVQHLAMIATPGVREKGFTFYRHMPTMYMYYCKVHLHFLSMVQVPQSHTNQNTFSQCRLAVLTQVTTLPTNKALNPTITLCSTPSPLPHTPTCSRDPRILSARSRGVKDGVPDVWWLKPFTTFPLWLRLATATRPPLARALFGIEQKHAGERGGANTKFSLPGLF